VTTASAAQGNGADRSAEVLGRLFDVRGERVVVTGAASGLGFAIAEVLADCGARVTLADVDGDRLAEATRSLADRGSRVRSATVDVSDATQVQGLIDEVVAADGGIDSVFASAGIAATPGFAAPGGQRLDSIVHSDWNQVLGVNLHGVLFTMQSAAAAPPS
jgi:NAD(P)-dependent dehydrogenase (short-subunit alcohol dehydrogenase family)